jgi:hypothetical protein
MLYYILNTTENVQYLTNIWGAVYSANFTEMYIIVNISKCEWNYTMGKYTLGREIISLETLIEKIRNKKLKDILKYGN